MTISRLSSNGHAYGWEGRKSPRKGSKEMGRSGKRCCMASDAISSAGLPLNISDSGVAVAPGCDPTGMWEPGVEGACEVAVGTTSHNWSAMGMTDETSWMDISTALC